jgi:hypothetical protein
MAKRFLSLNVPVLALGLATVGMAAAAFTIGNGDKVVERGFERALAARADRATQATGADQIVSARDHLKVSRVVHDAPAFSRPVSVGDRITINSRGSDRVLEVVKVDKLDSSIVPASSESPVPLLLVTCRDEAKPEARPVRFLIEADEALPALSSVATTPRTL